MQVGRVGLQARAALEFCALAALAAQQLHAKADVCADSFGQ